MTSNVTLKKMHHPDVSELVSRTFRSLGFDHDIARATDPSMAHRTYPPYNIWSKPKDEDSHDIYYIEIAVAGFSRDELKVWMDTSVGNKLRVEGTSNKSGPERVYHHRGLAQRNFELQFALHPQSEVCDVSLDGGILTIKVQLMKPEDPGPEYFEIS